MLLLFFVYVHGAGAWKKGETQSELLQQAQSVSARILRTVEQSSTAGLVIEPGPHIGTAIAYPRSWNEAAGRFEYDLTARRPAWQTYELYYYDATSQQIRYRELPYSGSGTATAPLPNLSSYLVGGQGIAREVTMCEFRQAGRLLKVEIRLERERYGSNGPETIELVSSVFLRNQ